MPSFFTAAEEKGTGSDQKVYAWDLDGDGIFGESGAAAGRGD